jgi:hypothetical protein
LRERDEGTEVSRNEWFEGFVTFNFLGSGGNPLLTFNSFRPFNSFILLLLQRKKERKLKDPVKVYD